MSKLGFYVRNQAGQVEVIRRCQPVVCKIELNGLDRAWLSQAVAASPRTLWVGRLVVDEQPLETVAHQRFVDRLLQVAEPFRGLIDALEGYNEVAIGDRYDMERWATLERYRADRLHLAGWRSVVGNFATGCPELAYWSEFDPALEVGDYLGLHEYSPSLPACYGDWSWHQGRFVRVYEQLSRKVPLVVTECGVDDGHGGGWKRHGSAEQYLDYLREYDAFLQRSGLPVVGATIFCYGRFPSDEWESFDVSDIANELAAYIASGREVEQMTELNQSELLDLCAREIGAGWQDIRQVLPRHPTLRWSKRALSEIDTVVVHWSATSVNTSSIALANYHIAGDAARDLPAAPGIRYHGVMYPWVVRLCNNLDDLVGHCGNDVWNRRGIGICFVTNTRPTPEALKLASQFISCLARWLGRDLAVIGHRDVPGANTECPGPTWREWMPMLVEAGRLTGAPDETETLRTRVAELERQLTQAVQERDALAEKVARALEVLS